MIHFLKYVYDCIWTDSAQALCAMAACEAILRGFSTHWPAQAGIFVHIMYFKYDSTRLPAQDNPSLRLAQLKLGGPSKINENGPACKEFLARLHLVIISTHAWGFFQTLASPAEIRE